MTTLKNLAQEYIAPGKILNISDAGTIDITTLEVVSEEHIDKDGKQYKILVTNIDNKKYRVPKQVIGDIKQILEVRPEVKFITVIKSGTGMATKYQVVPA